VPVPAPAPAPVATMEPWRIEELKTKRATYLMNTIATVGTFDGEPLELELFIEDMDAVNDLIQDNPIDDTTDRNIRRCFVGRISKDVLMETGIRATMTWNTIRDTLKERYARAREPVGREALRILRTNRGQNETPAEFGRRIGERTRLLRRKMWDTQQDEEATRVCVNMMEDLVKELVLQQIPERLRNAIRGKATSLEELLLAIRHEDEDSRQATREPSESWQVVPRRRPMARAPPRRAKTPPRTPREKPEWRPARRPPPREGPRRPTRGRQEGPAPRDNRECWQCQEVGHISRNCPYIYRRDRGGTRSSGGDWRGEPMEINATTRRERRRGGRRVRGLDDSVDSGEDTSTPGSASEKDDTPERPPRRWESPTVRSSPKKEEVRA
jgi:Zinc knuckle